MNVLGLGVSEHVLQGAQSQARMVRDGEPPLGEQAADLLDGPGHGGTVHAVEQGQNRVRQVVAQVDQCGHQPVHEDQPVPGTSTRRTLPLAAASGPEPAPLDPDHPRPGQLRY
ncbi:hypothetical protein GCM10010431_72250 [Streptomyces kunmingensis]